MNVYEEKVTITTTGKLAKYRYYDNGFFGLGASWGDWIDGNNALFTEISYGHAKPEQRLKWKCCR